MEAVQKWWEVPAIAHFCSIFRAVFNLLYFDVGELEAAILNMQDPEMSISLEQLITRLLQGCFDEGEITESNWEEKLRDLFEDNCDDGENPIIECAFCNFSPRSKVETLYKLCQIRLDIAASEDIIKDMPPEIMQAKCIGHDEKKYSYWYFNDERLYKESPIKIAGKTGKINTQGKRKMKDPPPLKSARSQKAQRKKGTDDELNDSWSIVCYNVSDWEKLIKIFSKSKSKLEKEMAKNMKTKYLENVANIVNEKEKLLRKRLLEMAPKRTSSRISKVQAQRKMEEQRLAEAEEQRRKELEIELARKEELKKIQEKESRSKRAEERSKIIEERAKRAQQRGMLKNYIDDYENSNSNDQWQRTNHKNNDQSERDNNNSNSSSEDLEEVSDDDNRENERKSFNDSEESESSNDESESESECCSEDEASDSTNNVEDQNFVQEKVVHTYDLTKWNSTIDSKGQKLHILKTPSNNIVGNKRSKIDEAGRYKVSSINGYHSTSPKGINNHQLFQVQTCKTYNNDSNQGVRISYLKSTARKVSS